MGCAPAAKRWWGVFLFMLLFTFVLFTQLTETFVYIVRAHTVIGMLLLLLIIAQASCVLLFFLQTALTAPGALRPWQTIPRVDEFIKRELRRHMGSLPPLPPRVSFTTANLASASASAAAAAGAMDSEALGGLISFAPAGAGDGDDDGGEHAGNANDAEERSQAARQAYQGPEGGDPQTLGGTSTDGDESESESESEHAPQQVEQAEGAEEGEQQTPQQQRAEGYDTDYAAVTDDITAADDAERGGRHRRRRARGADEAEVPADDPEAMARRRRRRLRLGLASRTVAEVAQEALQTMEGAAAEEADARGRCAQMLTRVGRCEECRVYLFDDTHHCTVCDRCTYRMQHHCVFTGACVGVDNHKYLLLLLIHTSLAAVHCLVATLVVIANGWNYLLINIDNPHDDAHIGYYYSFVLLITCSILCFSISFLHIRSAGCEESVLRAAKREQRAQVEQQQRHHRMSGGGDDDDDGGSGGAYRLLFTEEAPPPPKPFSWANLRLVFGEGPVFPRALLPVPARRRPAAEAEQAFWETLAATIERQLRAVADADDEDAGLTLAERAERAALRNNNTTNNNNGGEASAVTTGSPQPPPPPATAPADPSTYTFGAAPFVIDFDNLDGPPNTNTNAGPKPPVATAGKSHFD